MRAKSDYQNPQSKRFINLRTLRGFAAACVFFYLSVLRVPANGCMGVSLYLRAIQLSHGGNNQYHEVRFKLIAIGDTRAADGTHLGFRRYDSPDGTTVFLTYGRFQSGEKARQQLQFLLKSAKKIFEQSIRHDSLGKEIGERGVAVITDKKFHNEYTLVVWTDGRDGWWAESSSAGAALEFEDRVISKRPLTEEPVK